MDTDKDMEDCEDGFEIFRNGDYFEGINLLPIPTTILSESVGLKGANQLPTHTVKCACACRIQAK